MKKFLRYQQYKYTKLLDITQVVVDELSQNSDSPCIELHLCNQKNQILYEEDSIYLEKFSENDEYCDKYSDKLLNNTCQTSLNRFILKQFIRYGTAKFITNTHENHFCKYNFKDI